MEFMKAFMDQSMIAMMGEIVLFANAVTMAIPIRWRDNMMMDYISLFKKWIKENQKYWWQFVVFLHEVAHSLVSKLRPKVDQKAISDVNYEDVNYEDVNYERAKKDKLERNLKTWKSLGTYNK